LNQFFAGGVLCLLGTIQKRRPQSRGGAVHSADILWTSGVI